MEGESCSIARCTFKDSTFALQIPMSSSYSDVRREVKSLFDGVIVGNTELRYSFNDGLKCNLSSDRDLQMMFISQRIANSHFIEIELFDTSNSQVHINNVQGSAVIEHSGPVNDYDPAMFGEPQSEQIVSITDHWKTYISDVKQVFYGGAKEFRDHLIKYTIAIGFKIRFKKNDRTRVTAVCAKRDSCGCPWRIHASAKKINGNFYIRRVNNVHTCGGNVTASRHAMVNSRLVASLMMHMIRENPLYRPTDIMRDMKHRYGLDVPYWNAWYGRDIAKKELHGDENQSYQQLVGYLYAVLDTNPGSHCKIEFDEESKRFTRCFIAFGACINGFRMCRPLLCLDGTHLKSKHKGTLLVATRKNGEQGLYPVAFAIVDNESDESWSWFVEHLCHNLRQDDRRITFISDRNTGLINAIKKWFPDSPHGFCFHHLKTNIMARFSGSVNKGVRDKVLKLFCKCAYTFSKKAFHKNLDEMKQEGKAVIESFLTTLPFKHWANSYFTGERYGEMSSNIVESFNSMVLQERTMPITQLIDGIRARLMKFIGDRSYEASKWTSMLCPTKEKLIQKFVKDGQHWMVNRSNHDVYEVMADFKCKVDLGSRNCSCSYWKLYGFPCVHAITVMKFLDIDPYQFVDNYFKAETFRECYSHSILPIIQHADDMLDDDEIPLLLPPKTKAQPGRPRTNRFKSKGEIGKIKCGRCGELGSHNRRTCSVNI